MQGIPADGEEKDGTLQKIRKRHAWAVPEGSSLGRKQTCGISSSRVSGHVQQSMGKHATVRWATRKAARWCAKSPEHLAAQRGEAVPPARQFPASWLCWVPPAFWGDGVIWGVLLHRASFFLHPAGARPVGRPHPGLLLPSFCHQVRLHLHVEGGLHHQSWPEG